MYESIELEGVKMRLAIHPKVWRPTTFAQNFARHLAPLITPDLVALELGLGSGVLSILGAQLGADITGLDINPDAVQVTSQNWEGAGLPEKSDRFRISDRFTALQSHEQFDLIWSNPPVLPKLPEIKATNDRNDFEVAGDHGRLVLDAVLTQSGALLRDGGQILTISTSLQGKAKTEALLDAHWGEWSYLEHLELALTDECGPPYIDWWLARTAEDGQERIYRRHGSWWHSVWIVSASRPKLKTTV